MVRLLESVNAKNLNVVHSGHGKSELMLNMESGNHGRIQRWC